MNERIKELAEQANLTACIDEAYLERGDWTTNVEKFAELIVERCAELCIQVGSFINEEEQSNYVAAHTCAHVLKECFGIKDDSK